MIVFLICDYKNWGWRGSETPQNGYEIVYEEGDSIIYAIDKEFFGPKDVQPHKIFINRESSHNSPEWISNQIKNRYPNVRIIKKSSENIIAWVMGPQKYLNNIL